MKNATNTFSKGLIMDVHPMTAPQDTMSNALNATLLTYDGNEFILQNDNGNTKIDSAYLPTGYIPVGIKSYGGIIYVASYNPFTKMSQVGSFPSPQRLNHSQSSGDNYVTVTEKDFTDVKNIVLKDIFNSTVFNPGDEFAISIDIVNDTDIFPKSEKLLKQLITNYGDGELAKFIKVELVVDSENVGPSDLINYTNKYFAEYQELPDPDLFQIYKNGSSKLLLKCTLEGIQDFSVYSNIIGVDDSGNYTVEVVGTSEKYTKNNYYQTLYGTTKLFEDRILYPDLSEFGDDGVQQRLYDYEKLDNNIVNYHKFSKYDYSTNTCRDNNINGGELFSLKFSNYGSSSDGVKPTYVYGDCSVNLETVLNPNGDVTGVVFRVIGGDTIYTGNSLSELISRLTITATLGGKDVEAISINNKFINLVGKIMSSYISNSASVKIYYSDGSIEEMSGESFRQKEFIITNPITLKEDQQVELTIKDYDFYFQGTLQDLLSVLHNPTAYYKDGYVAIRHFITINKTEASKDWWVTPRSEQFEYNHYKQRLVIDPSKFNTNTFNITEYQYFKLQDRMLLKLSAEYYPKLGYRYSDLFIQFYNIEQDTSIFWKVSNSVKSVNGTFLLSFPFGEGLPNVENELSDLSVLKKDFPKALKLNEPFNYPEYIEDEFIKNAQYATEQSTLKPNSFYAVGIYLIEDASSNVPSSPYKVRDKYAHRYMYTTSLFNEYYDVIPDFKDCKFKATIHQTVDKKVNTYLSTEQTDPEHFYRHSYSEEFGQQFLEIEQSRQVSSQVTLEIKNTLVGENKYFGKYNPNCITYRLASEESIVAEFENAHRLFNTYQASDALKTHWLELPKTVSKIHLKNLDTGTTNKFEFISNPQFDNEVSRLWLSELTKFESKQQLTNIVKPLWEWQSGVENPFNLAEANKVIYGVVKDYQGNFTLSGRDIITYGYDGVGYNSYDVENGFLKSPSTGTKAVVDGSNFLSQDQFNNAILKATKEVFGKTKYEELPLFVPIMIMLRPETHFYNTDVVKNDDKHKVGYYHIPSNDWFNSSFSQGVSYDNDEQALIHRFGWCDRSGISSSTELGTPVKWAINMGFNKAETIVDGKKVVNYVVVLAMKDGNGSYTVLPHEFPHIFYENYDANSKLHKNLMSFTDILQMIVELYSQLYIVKPAEEVIEFQYSGGFINDVQIDTVPFNYTANFDVESQNYVLTFKVGSRDFAFTQEKVQERIFGNRNSEGEIPGHSANIPACGYVNDDSGQQDYKLIGIDDLSDINIELNVNPEFSDLSNSLINPELTFPETNVAVAGNRIINKAIIPIINNDPDLGNKFPTVSKFDLRTYREMANDLKLFFNREVVFKAKPLKPNTIYINFNNSAVKVQNILDVVPTHQSENNTALRYIPDGIKDNLSLNTLEYSIFCIFDGGIPTTDSWEAGIPSGIANLYQYSALFTDEYKQMVSKLQEHGGFVAIDDLALVAPLTYQSFGNSRKTFRHNGFTSNNKKAFTISNVFPIKEFLKFPHTYNGNYYGGIFFRDRFLAYSKDGYWGAKYADLNTLSYQAKINNKFVYEQVVGINIEKLLVLSLQPYCLFSDARKLKSPIRNFQNLEYLKYYLKIKDLVFNGWTSTDITGVTTDQAINKTLRKQQLYSQDNTIYFWSPPKYTVPTSFSHKGQQHKNEAITYIGPSYQPYISPFGLPTPSILYFPGFNFHYTPYFE